MGEKRKGNSITLSPSKFWSIAASKEKKKSRGPLCEGEGERMGMIEAFINVPFVRNSRKIGGILVVSFYRGRGENADGERKRRRKALPRLNFP